MGSKIYTLSLKNIDSALAGVAQLVGLPFHEAKGHQFDSQSGHMPGLQAQSPAGSCLRGDLPSLPLSLKINK